MLRTLPSLGGVFRQVLEHGPKVQERTPVDITHVGKEQVFFEVVDQPVVTL